MNQSSERRYQNAGEILDTIREQLNEKPQDDMTLLLKIFRDLKTLDAYKMSPHDAARWLIQEETEREKRHTEFAIQTGVRRGIKYGLLIGFLLGLIILPLLGGL